MLKREVKDKQKSGKRYLVIILILCFFLTSIAAASAEDIAYIYKKNYKVDENVLGVFNELGLSYKLIDERYLPSNFSNYKIIFAGDERFVNAAKIPVNEKPSIISNYYFGEEWGLTDYDGISQLAATSPLSVKKDNKIMQVYTQATYSNDISIPYYYLDDENKASGMQSVARTYTGNDNHYDFGDVISYANVGRLINGKNTQGKLCFFGIVKSDYWTPAAKQLFKDCVGFVALTCSKNADCGEEKEGEKYCKNNDVYRDITRYSCINPGTAKSECKKEINSVLVEQCDEVCVGGECKHVECYKDEDCDDGNNYTKDICEKPGTPESYCKHEPLMCLKSSDCGIDGFIGEKYCQDNKVYQDYINFSCADNKCSNSTSAKLIENCTDVCRNGACVERECTRDSNCPADYYGEKYCEGNKTYKDLHDFSCQQEMCKENIIKELVDECGIDEICTNGECKGILCRIHADCGTNSFVGNRYCKNENVYQDFISFVCSFPGTVDSYCSNYTLPILVEYCDFTCVSGECIACFNNLSCGIDGFIGEKYCDGNDVYQNYKQFECTNPGTPESDCLSSVWPKLIEECDEICANGECKHIECYKDEDCDDNNAYTIDECNNPGTIDSYCTNTEINCLNNNDCGATGFFGEEYCYEEDVFKEYKNSTCINAGTKESYCEISVEPRFILDCGEDSCSDWSNYCKGDEVWRNRSCYDRGCADGECLSKLISQEELVKECEYSCENGECVGECDDNSDCSDGLYCNGEEKCINNECEDGTEIDCSVFNIPKIETCNNIPDNNSLTWDYFAGFISICNENTDSCTTGNLDLTHNCDESCGAECTINSDCPEKCTQDSHKLYTFLGCNKCECDYSGYKCVVGKCGAECDENSDCTCQQDYCNGTTLVDYSNYSSCGTSGSQGCLCQACNATMIYNSPICGYVEHYCGDNNLDAGEECDDGNNINGDGCSSDCEIEYECEIDSDCDDDYYKDNYCLNNDVYKNLVDYFCLSHIAYNTCAFNEIPELVESCGEGSSCGDWQNYCMGKEVWRNRTCYNKGCADGECFGTEDTQAEKIKECEDACINGECTEITCNKNSDCGVDGWLNGDYCQCTKEVWDFWLAYTCIAPGTSQSRCEMNMTAKLKQDCGESYCGNWSYYCKEKDVWKTRNCSERGCVNATCFLKDGVQDELAENCEYGCLDGECVDECTKDSDCGIQTSELICQDKNVTNKTITPTCSAGICINTTTYKFKEYCEYGCLDGECLNECETDSDCDDDYYSERYCKDDDVYHDLHDFSCKQGSCNEETIPKLVEECEYGCANGYCEDECKEKIIDWYDTKYLSSEVKENEGDSWKKISEFVKLEPKVIIFEQLKGESYKMQSAINIENDGYIIFKNKMRDGGVVIIKPLIGELIVIQAIDNAFYCPGKNNAACIYSRDGKLLYSYKIATHSTTAYSKVLGDENYIGECPGKNILEIINDKELPNLYCGVAETKVELKAGDIVYFRGEDSNEKAGSGIEVWQDCQNI